MSLAHFLNILPQHLSVKGSCGLLICSSSSLLFSFQSCKELAQSFLVRWSDGDERHA